MEIITPWFENAQVSSDEISRSWKVSRDGQPDFVMQIWFDFSKIVLSCGEETETFAFNINVPGLPGIPKEDDHFLKKISISTKSFFFILMSCAMNFGVFLERGFKKYVYKVASKNVDCLSFLCESLSMIETGLSIAVGKDLLEFIPAGTIVVSLDERRFVVADSGIVSYVEKIPEKIFLFAHWILNETSMFFVPWEKKETSLSEFWNNPSTTDGIYSLRYRERFGYAVDRLKKMDLSFEIPELRPRHFTLKLKKDEVMQVSFCFAAFGFRIRHVVDGEKIFLLVW
jgi:hypothetical protein